MSPLEAILQWLIHLDEESRREVAMMMAFLLFDEYPMEENNASWQAVDAWLRQPNALRTRTLGKAITFRACFENQFSARFTAKGWTETQSFIRRIVDEGTNDPESDAGKVAGAAFKMLREVPEREAVWKDIEASWRTLVEDFLSDDALRVWHFA